MTTSNWSAQPNERLGQKPCVGTFLIYWRPCVFVHAHVPLYLISGLVISFTRLTAAFCANTPECVHWLCDIYTVANHTVCQT